MEAKVNMTFMLPKEQVNLFEDWVKSYGINIIDYRILPNTDKLKETDSYFQNLIAMKKRLSTTIGEYINEHNTDVDA